MEAQASDQSNLSSSTSAGASSSEVLDTLPPRNVESSYFTTLGAKDGWDSCPVAYIQAGMFLHMGSWCRIRFRSLDQLMVTMSRDWPDIEMVRPSQTALKYLLIKPDSFDHAITMLSDMPLVFKLPTNARGMDKPRARVLDTLWWVLRRLGMPAMKFGDIPAEWARSEQIPTCADPCKDVPDVRALAIPPAYRGTHRWALVPLTPEQREYHRAHNKLPSKMGFMMPGPRLSDKLEDQPRQIYDLRTPGH